MTTSNVPARRPLTSRNTVWAANGARFLANSGISPNAISVASIFFAAVAGASFFWTNRSTPLLAPWFFVAGALAVQGRLLCNLMDGMVAIEGGKKTRSGDIFNELPDRIADPLILIGAGYALGSGMILGWLAATLALLTAYIRALGVAAGASQQFCGPMAKPQRMAIVTAASIIAAVAWWLSRPLPAMRLALMVICAGCIVTIVRRTIRIIRELEAK